MFFFLEIIIFLNYELVYISRFIFVLIFKKLIIYMYVVLHPRFQFSIKWVGCVLELFFYHIFIFSKNEPWYYSTESKKKKNQLINVFIVVSWLVSVSPMISWASVYDLVCFINKLIVVILNVLLFLYHSILNKNISNEYCLKFHHIYDAWN